jgi:Na+-driven multidrug efflux pump
MKVCHCWWGWWGLLWLWPCSLVRAFAFRRLSVIRHTESPLAPFFSPSHSSTRSVKSFRAGACCGGPALFPSPAADSASYDEDDLSSAVRRQLLSLASPAFLSLALEPVVSAALAVLTSTRLDVPQQAAAAAANAVHFSVSKLFNDPLLRVPTSLVAAADSRPGRSRGEGGRLMVTTSVAIALAVGLLQCCLFLGAAQWLLVIFGASPEVRETAVRVLQLKALGVPAQTVSQTAQGIFRGMSDTTTPLLCSSLGSFVTVSLAGLLLQSMQHQRCAAVALAWSVGQWAGLIPLLYLLPSYLNDNTENDTTDSNANSGNDSTGNNDNCCGRTAVTALLFTKRMQAAAKVYGRACSLLWVRTVTKVATLSVCAAMAARLGNQSLAAYWVCFQLGTASAQLCEAFGVAAQALVARESPFKTEIQQKRANEIVRQVTLISFVASLVLTTVSWVFGHRLLSAVCKSPQVLQKAKDVFPLVLCVQFSKAMSYALAGSLMGGLDWLFLSNSLQIASVVSLAALGLLIVGFNQNNLQSIFISLLVFLGTQVRSDSLVELFLTVL